MARELLTGWGRTAPSAAEMIECTDETAVRRALGHAPSRGMIARGSGRSYGDASQNAGGQVLVMVGEGQCSRVDGDGGSGLLRAAGNVSLDTIMRRLVPEGWFPPVTPGTRHVTVGGAVAGDIHGKNHHRDGTFSAHVTLLELATPTGMRTPSPTEDSELFWATAGGMGLTGAITAATLAMTPIRTSRMRVVTQRAKDLDQLMARMEEADGRHRYSVAWIDGMARGSALGRSVLSAGDHAEPDELDADGRRRPLRFDPRPGHGPVPTPALGRILNRATVRAFNEVWFRRAPRAATTTIADIAGFFHPLDAIGDWNRLYGRRGFLQYQFVVPFGAERVLLDTLGRLSAAGYPSFLAVLKRFGPASPGPLSFPLPGWTLALDLPAGLAGLAAFLDDLDDLVVEAGGRVYLAKDSRLRPDVVAAMYPRLDEWRATRAEVDPEGVLRSDLARRLHLVEGP